MRRLTRGFTLIELMIVVAIIGILAAVGVPSFLRMQCRSKQTEVKSILKALYTIEEGYAGEYGSYLTINQLTTFGGMDHRTIAGAKYYSFTAINPGGLDFRIESKDNLAGILTAGPNDFWMLEAQNPRPMNLVDRCYEVF